MPLEKIVKASLSGGIHGFVCSNTLGPGLFLHDGHPILTNKLGGVSGKAILPLVLKSIRQIRSLTSKPIIGCGGISSAQDIKNYQQVGANFFGIGSALAGMSTNEIKKYFNLLEKDISNQTNLTSHKLKTKLFCNYKPFKITKKQFLTKIFLPSNLTVNLPSSPANLFSFGFPVKGRNPFLSSIINHHFFLSKKEARSPKNYPNFLQETKFIFGGHTVGVLVFQTNDFF